MPRAPPATVAVSDAQHCHSQLRFFSREPGQLQGTGSREPETKERRYNSILISSVAPSVALALLLEALLALLLHGLVSALHSRSPSGASLCASSRISPISCAAAAPPPPTSESKRVARHLTALPTCRSTSPCGQAAAQATRLGEGARVARLDCDEGWEKGEGAKGKRARELGVDWTTGFGVESRGYGTHLHLVDGQRLARNTSTDVHSSVRERAGCRQEVRTSSSCSSTSALQ